MICHDLKLRIHEKLLTTPWSFCSSWIGLADSVLEPSSLEESSLFFCSSSAVGYTAIGDYLVPNEKPGVGDDRDWDGEDSVRSEFII